MWGACFNVELNLLCNSTAIVPVPAGTSNALENSFFSSEVWTSPLKACLHCRVVQEYSEIKHKPLYPNKQCKGTLSPFTFPKLPGPSWRCDKVFYPIVFLSEGSAKIGKEKHLCWLWSEGTSVPSQTPGVSRWTEIKTPMLWMGPWTGTNVFFFFFCRTI